MPTADGVFVFLLSGLPALAQTISGRVVSGDDQQPLPGVSIVVKGSTTGTATRSDGTYSINVPSSTATLTDVFIYWVRLTGDYGR
ncbi:TonB-dependent receptor plug [Fibrisoma limi BUZ 3]|uniref:TonB-dependent receptor plug n=1 Tax=Fibrisoma limi BUZ 3 TaxID=1185876 RepID=I2GL03_9BACT|nr:carboxypeptidase-like regulatory domain-containing protein [Fibrisoma limi]CCH54579.1 TonB-dependent receptor plug [Fibrisoma limi BUZ 3]